MVFLNIIFWLIILILILISSYDNIAKFICVKIIPRIFKSWKLIEFDMFEAVYYSESTKIYIIVNILIRYIEIYYIEDDFYEKYNEMTVFGITSLPGTIQLNRYEKNIFLICKLISLMINSKKLRVNTYNDKINNILDILD